MTITLLTGFQDSGKTLACCKFVLKDFLKGRQIYTNTWFKFGHIFINKDFLLDMIEQGVSIPDITYCLDEIWLWADARKRTAMLSYFYLQSSKDNANLFMTAQTSKQVDNRLRDNLNYWGECERKIYHKGRLVDIPKKYRDERTDLPIELQNRLFIVVKMYRHRSNVNMGNYLYDFELIKIYNIYAKPFFNLYNTRQKIKIKVS